MDAVLRALTPHFEHLLDRAGGPLHCRLLIMPLVVTFLAVRTGMKDARDGHPPFLRRLVANPLERRRLIRTALQDIGRVLVMAVVLDTTYQLVVLRAFYPGELLIVVVACAVLPYLALRGPVSSLMRRLYRNQGHNRTGASAASRPLNRSAPENTHE